MYLVDRKLGKSRLTIMLTTNSKESFIKFVGKIYHSVDKNKDISSSLKQGRTLSQY